MKGVSKLWLFAAVILALLLSGCRADGGESIVGHWRNWDGLFHMQFTAGGEVIYDIADRPEYLPHIVHGTYQIISEDQLLIDIAHEQSGEYTFQVEGDVFQLTDASGARTVYHRVKGSTEQ